MLAALVALALVPAGSASAAKPLTEERATVLATKLGREVAKERNPLYWRIQRLVKKRTNRFVFEYFERLREDDRFCKANVVVQQSGSRRTASLTGSRCATMRADVLAVEDAVAIAIDAVIPKVPQIRAGNRDFERRLESCEALDYPNKYFSDVHLLFELGTDATIYAPIGAEVDAHARRLGGIQTGDSSLRAGFAAWRKVLDILAAAPAIARDPCPPLREWARADYDPSAAPVDFARVRSLHRSLIKYERRILTAGDRLYLLGVPQRVFAAFTPYGLTVQAALEYEPFN
ncbi:MAG TPA: hypothetical protein VF715_10400 [Thermoleophilaceae bacterium]